MSKNSRCLPRSSEPLPAGTDERTKHLLVIYLSGADRDRTDDPRLAKPVLSQLSYSPGSTSIVGDDDCGPGWTRTTDLTLIRRTL